LGSYLFRFLPPFFFFGAAFLLLFAILFFILNFDAIGLPTAPINFQKTGEVILLKIYLTLIVANPFSDFSQNCA